MKIWLIWLLFGILLIAGGILALANPFAATLAVDILVGVLFVLSGVVQLLVAFRSDAGDGRVWTGLVGLLALLLGISLLFNPVTGAISLTLVLGILLLAMGIFRLFLAWMMRDTPVFWLLLLSGAVTFLIGVLIFSDVQAAGTQLLGILLGIDLIADGLGFVAFGLIARKL
ncbi:MAG: hypothetical protein CL814_07965 [Confluentimicrobium sp.]|jgi:uncharacterized membrane protein HdeD (DUF308 family)|uniref:HdeD family acid-resistance protein n=1 Tax=Actibacterium sp. TaxID=1872125 RepID=UPI00050EDD13|nr:DUF308 domain-containing protein [Actibacterium sp.]KGB82513.1 hypothetical protein JT55_07595 [Rhodovulum sp. NI22]MBC56855.1 hypothetical protein [Actibacterium sp.]MDY6859171.1 DUF308 domain-containing protein [Pseudomonadota bacterium]|tara:strand:+ start:270 stop:782 length:513 start_codon:yes stop_codon:yes gene_type:complete